LGTPASPRKAIRTAAVLWPVTGHAKEIKYNIPEAHPLPGKSQIAANLASGSKLLQLKMFLRHRKLMQATRQPYLDNFATACMVDILAENRPELALMHLTAYDAFCHLYGKNGAELPEAYEAMDRNLGLLLDAAGDEYDVVLFSDHGQIDVHTVVPINDLLVERGLLGRTGDTYILKLGCFIECCGGSAFFEAGSLPDRQVRDVRAAVAVSAGFRRFLTEAELRESGREDRAFGFCAQAGYTYEVFPPQKRGDHGYPKDMPDYKVFYMVRGEGFPAGTEKKGGSLLDVAPMAAKILGLDPW
jgi:hypothetical protein